MSSECGFDENADNWDLDAIYVDFSISNNESCKMGIHKMIFILLAIVISIAIQGFPDVLWNMHLTDTVFMKSRFSK